jgi:hypothetical protein
MIISSSRRMPDKSAGRVERPEGGLKGERSESSMVINRLDAGLRQHDELIRASLDPEMLCW